MTNPHSLKGNGDLPLIHCRLSFWGRGERPVSNEILQVGEPIDFKVGGSVFECIRGVAVRDAAGNHSRIPASEDID